jgi:ATP/maltotriose-dependent transcriptional regulator MalT/transcriptional regulator with XRE-family HTH domain
MMTRRTQLPAASFADFGTLLRVLRRGARLTQRDLGIAVGYSEAQISRLEQGKRRPDAAVVAALFVPSLGLSGEPELAGRLHALALAARDAREGPEPGPAGNGPRRDGAATHADDLAAIPAAPRPCVARPAAAAGLRDRLAEVRRVLVCGPPGVGKTTLAAAVARELADDVPVCWLTLTEGITTPEEAVVRRLARFLDRLGRPEAAPLLEPGQAQRPLPPDERLHLLATALNRGEALICLDNAQLLGGEPGTRAVVEHLAASSRATFLAVSREDSQLSGFEPFPLGGLDRGEARVLVERLAGDALPAPLAGRLIDRTDGNPMLIRLALGPAGGLGSDPAALIERLEAQSGVSAYLLQATLAGLTDAGRLLVALLAVFRHPVDLLDERLIEASVALEGRYDVIGGIGELRRRQLVEHTARAALHPLVRDRVYADLAGDTGRRRNLHRLAAAHCEQVLTDPLEASWHYARAGEPAEAADLLVASVPDLTVSGRCARAADLATELLGGGQLAEEATRQLLVARGDLLVHTERAAAAEDSYRDAFARPAPPAVRAGVAWRLAQCLLLRGQVPEALDLCRAAAAGLTAGDGILSAHLATVQSQAHMMLSDYAQATATATRALGLADQVATVTVVDAAGIKCRALGVLGVVARLRGQPDEARRMLRLSLTAARTARRRDMVGRALFNLAAIAHEHGELDGAERLYDEALAEMRSIGDGFGTAGVLHSLGKIHFHRCAADEAMALFLESVALRRRLGDAQGAANSEHSYAHVLLSVGRTAEARELLESALRVTADLGERRSRGHYLDSLAMIALVDGDVEAADEHLAEAGEIAAAIDEPRLRATVTVHQALAHLARGDLAAARRTAPAVGTEPDGSLLALERSAVTACVALAGGDRPTAARQAAAMERSAAASGFSLEARAARRISAAAGRDPAKASTGAEAGAGTWAGAARYPRLIWVSDEAPGLEFPVPDASLTRS